MEKLAGVVPAAGEGTRLRPLTFSLPKQLIPLLGRAVIEYPISHLAESGVEEATVVIGHLGFMIREYLGSERSGVRLKYVMQEKRLGIAHAVARAIEEGSIDSPIIVYLGDNIVSGGIRRFVEEFLEGGYDAYVLLARVRDPRRFGVAIVEGGRIVKLVEKPREPPSDLALVGVYMFRDPDVVMKAFRELKPSWRGEYEITDLIQKLIDWGFKVGYSIVRGWWKDVGTPEGLLEAIHLLLDEAEPRIEGVVEGEVRGRVVVEKGAVVEGDVYGPAYVGRNAYVTRRARVEHYVSLEAGSTLQSGKATRSHVLGEGANLDLGEARLVDSVVGRGCRVRIRGVRGEVKLILGDRAVVEL